MGRKDIARGEGGYEHRTQGRKTETKRLTGRRKPEQRKNA